MDTISCLCLEGSSASVDIWIGDLILLLQDAYLSIAFLYDHLVLFLGFDRFWFRSFPMQYFNFKSLILRINREFFVWMLQMKGSLKELLFLQADTVPIVPPSTTFNDFCIRFQITEISSWIYMWRVKQSLENYIYITSFMVVCTNLLCRDSRLYYKPSLSMRPFGICWTICAT